MTARISVASNEATGASHRENAPFVHLRSALLRDKTHRTRPPSRAAFCTDSADSAANPANPFRTPTSPGVYPPVPSPSPSPSSSPSSSSPFLPLPSHCVYVYEARLTCICRPRLSTVSTLRPCPYPAMRRLSRSLPLLTLLSSGRKIRISRSLFDSNACCM